MVKPWLQEQAERYYQCDQPGSGSGYGGYYGFYGGPPRDRRRLGGGRSMFGGSDFRQSRRFQADAHALEQQPTSLLDDGRGSKPKAEFKGNLDDLE